MKAFVNGNVYLSFSPVRKGEAFLVANGRVLKTGSSGGIKELAERLGAELIDLEGKTVMPGFIDSHLHMEELGMALLTLDLRGVRSIEELKERLRDYAEKTEGWIIGHGWDQELFREKRWPNRFDLDEVVSDRPVILSRVCLHAAVLNTRAMELTGLLEAEVPGVVRENGKATGVVKEEAFELARERFKESLTVEDYKRFILTAQEHLLSLGVTAVGTMSVEEKVIRALSELEAEGRLKLRVFAYLDPGKRGKEFFEDTSILECLEKLGVRSGFGRRRLRIAGIKVLADGSLGARTAWLSEPYSDAETSGYPNVSREKLEEVASRTDRAGLQMAIHGIGDRAIDMILDVYSLLGLGHRLEHASVIRPDQIKRLSELGVLVSVQPHFVVTDWWAVERVGEERVRWVYPFRSMLKAGIILGFGTDAPVEPADPWETVVAAVLRPGKLGELTPGERLSVEEALKAYTLGSAALLGDEELGALCEGKMADFIVLSQDPLKVEPEKLEEIKVEETWISGERVFRAG